MYRIDFTRSAVKDIAKIEKSDLKSFRKLEKLIKELKLHPRTGTGMPEQLKHQSGEIWSRRLNKKDRLVYEIFEQEITITVVQSLGHYSDK